ncbi:hypothetical protein G6F40_016138 [Rhizopus arrhizus]|nr:hypothetical protein G6F40_016138 [Rhizopus arrhizus]
MQPTWTARINAWPAAARWASWRWQAGTTDAGAAHPPVRSDWPSSVSMEAAESSLRWKQILHPEPRHAHRPAPAPAATDRRPVPVW